MEEHAHRVPPFGGSETFRSIYEAFYPQVLAYCARRVGRNNAADVAADVFTVAWRRFDAIPHGDQALPWLYGVAYRVVLHHHRSGERSRRLTRKLAVSPGRPIVGPETHLVQREEYELVLAAVARLRPVDQEVLLLSVWEELANEEIAAALGSSVPAIRQRFHRAKRALRREFERIGGTMPPQSVAREGGKP